MTIALTSAIVNGAIVSALVTFIVATLLRIPRFPLNASTRYAVWVATLILAIVLPLGYLRLQEGQETAAKPAASMVIDARQPLVPPNTQLLPLSPERPSLHLFGTPVSPLRTIELRAKDRLLWLYVTWAGATALMLLRLLLSLSTVQRRKEQHVALPSTNDVFLTDWLNRCGSARAATLVISDKVVVPMATGPFRPAVLIPFQLFDALTSEEFEQIGLHEAAHLARYDDFAILAQRIIEAMFVFHPVIRWITCQLDLEREIACDDIVVQVTGRRRSYAECLARVAELANGVVRPPVAATGGISVLEKRLDRLMAGTRQGGAHFVRTRFATVAAMMLFMICIAWKAPMVLAFKEPLSGISVALPYTSPELAAGAKLPQAPAAPPIPSVEPTANSEKSETFPFTAKPQEGQQVQPFSALFGPSSTSSAGPQVFSSIFGPSTPPPGPDLTPAEIAAGIHGIRSTPVTAFSGLWQTGRDGEVGTEFTLTFTGSDLTVNLVPESNAKYLEYQVALQAVSNISNIYKGVGYFVARMDNGMACRFETEWLLTVIQTDRIVGTGTNATANPNTCEVQETNSIRLDLSKIK